jgi:hypothetical protein
VEIHIVTNPVENMLESDTPAGAESQKVFLRPDRAYIWAFYRYPWVAHSWHRLRMGMVLKPMGMHGLGLGQNRKPMGPI